MSKATTNYENCRSIAYAIVEVLEEKGETYGDSWRQRGGVGAFMMLARKWDRIENIAQANGYDIFSAIQHNIGDVKDDVKDLVGYFLLVLEHTES